MSDEDTGSSDSKTGSVGIATGASAGAATGAILGLFAAPFGVLALPVIGGLIGAIAAGAIVARQIDAQTKGKIEKLDE
jgi:hypothetical protein